MSSIISLKDRHTDATRELILSTAMELLVRSGVGELTIRAVAKQAGMSERTIFRYYATRDEFLDAVAYEASRSMKTPRPPATMTELLDYPGLLYQCFEERANLVEAVLHTEIFKRIRSAVAIDRWHAVRALIDQNAAHRSEQERMVASTNINYYLSATTWHYYRSQFELSIEATTECAASAVRLISEEIVNGPYLPAADIG